MPPDPSVHFYHCGSIINKHSKQQNRAVLRLEFANWSRDEFSSSAVDKPLPCSAADQDSVYSLVVVLSSVQRSSSDFCTADYCAYDVHFYELRAAVVDVVAIIGCSYASCVVRRHADWV